MLVKQNNKKGADSPLTQFNSTPSYQPLPLLFVPATSKAELKTNMFFVLLICKYDVCLVLGSKTLLNAMVVVVVMGTQTQMPNQVSFTMPQERIFHLNKFALLFSFVWSGLAQVTRSCANIILLLAGRGKVC